ncbi:Gfo/Idh/MocA family oxidoreductase [Candidatus Woesearchaeota archaeon]|nr:Gfo/Idh/MocA family oxidoreductase [Candidatus Woesearchaeota archaeon]
MVKLGIIGYGYWGPNLVRNFNSIPDSEVVYCADFDEKRLQHVRNLYPKTNITKDYKNILNDKDVDAVIVATPIETHYKIAKDCLDAGKHVLVEKPITASSEEAKSLIKAAEKSKKVLMVDHTFEYSTPAMKVKEIISSGELGKIFTIDMIRVNLGLFQEKVNVIWDLAPHDISMLMYYLGHPPTAVRAVGQSYVRNGIEDDAHINLEFKDKVMANMHVSWLDPMKIRKTTIVGNKKMLVFDDTLDNEKIRIYDKGVTIEKNNIPRQPYYDTFEQWKLTYRSGDVHAPKIENKESLNTMARHFIGCIKNNKKPLTDGFSGLRVVKVLEAMQESLKDDGRKVNLKND